MLPFKDMLLKSIVAALIIMILLFLILKGSLNGILSNPTVTFRTNVASIFFSLVVLVLLYQAYFRR